MLRYYLNHILLNRIISGQNRETFTTIHFSPRNQKNASDEINETETTKISPIENTEPTLQDSPGEKKENLTDFEMKMFPSKQNSLNNSSFQNQTSSNFNTSSQNEFSQINTTDVNEIEASSQAESTIITYGKKFLCCRYFLYVSV